MTTEGSGVLEDAVGSSALKKQRQEASAGVHTLFYLQYESLRRHFAARPPLKSSSLVSLKLRLSIGGRSAAYFKAKTAMARTREMKIAPVMAVPKALVMLNWAKKRSSLCFGSVSCF
jgi:hypothetical protein